MSSGVSQLSGGDTSSARFVGFATLDPPWPLRDNEGVRIHHVGYRTKCRVRNLAIWNWYIWSIFRTLASTDQMDGQGFRLSDSYTFAAAAITVTASLSSLRKGNDHYPTPVVSQRGVKRNSWHLKLRFCPHCHELAAEDSNTF